MKQTRKEKLANYIANKGFETFGNLVTRKYLDLCEIVEFELKENIFDVLDGLNIKYDKHLRNN